MSHDNQKSSVSVLGSFVKDCIRHQDGSKRLSNGGSALYASLGASFYSQVYLIGAIGNDWDSSLFDLWETKNILTDNVLEDPNQPSFYWEGQYTKDLSHVETVTLNENVYTNFFPTLLDVTQQSFSLLLGNCHPQLQKHVLQQTKSSLVGLDSISVWIENEKETLLSLIKEVDILFINDHEARELSNCSNLNQATLNILDMGCSYVVIKKGEHGAFIQSQDKIFSVPAYPVLSVQDTTGAGDSFAGSFLDYCANEESTSWETFQKALIWGTSISSFTVEGYGIERISSVSFEEAEDRFNFLNAMTQLN